MAISLHNILLTEAPAACYTAVVPVGGHDGSITLFSRGAPVRGVALAADAKVLRITLSRESGGLSASLESFAVLTAAAAESAMPRNKSTSSDALFACGEADGAPMRRVSSKEQMGG